MAKIVGVHGIGQEVRGPEMLRTAWAPALRDGVALSGAASPPPGEFDIAFYGDVFRPPGTKAVGMPGYTAADITPGFEQDLLAGWWTAAAACDAAVPGPADLTKARTPRMAQRALNAISQSSFFSALTERVIISFIKQVHAYLTDERVRSEIQARVEAVVGPDTAVLVGHSLGSVVAYEAAAAHPEWDLALVTLGSPLGIRNLVFDRLRPRPQNDTGHFPAAAATWTNVADAGDVVALVKQLAPLFGSRVQDLQIHNGSKAHDVSPYLTAVQTGQAVAAGLARRDR
ncbi:MAG TPA: alpha/beta hydrolase [Streptosporangiaceae bacterium]|nr:alpha/beta hydrolase [Streptosporangiaceae bacterium]